MIPDELKAYTQWIVWRYATVDNRPTKIPYSAITHQKASVSDSETWATYDVCQQILTASSGYYNGLGFVLTKDDPYSFIDLDNPEGDPAVIKLQYDISESFDTYSERSPSGRGLHLILKGNIGDGRRRHSVEVYSSLRYMTMTGDTYHNKPIESRQALLELLWAELGNNKQMLVDERSQPQKYTDDQVYDLAMRATNGSRFVALWRGDWNKLYRSHSEADFALINIISFYSRNSEQIRRMFLASALGGRSKAKREKYQNDMIRRSFDNEPPPISIESLLDQVTTEIRSHNPFTGPLFNNGSDAPYECVPPPGLLGDLFEYIYDSAPRQVKEIALATSIALMAGICGKAFNVSSTGLNQYILILAESGRGKDHARTAINQLVEAVKPGCPHITDFIGPAEIASGQALVRYLGEQPCFTSVVGEFGLLMQQICSPSANLAQIQLRRTLLDLYMRSGQHDTLQPSIYSDKAKNTTVIHSPAVTLLGESTPAIYYGSIDESMIQQGLLPRFLCIEYQGRRPPLNKKHALVKPSDKLVSSLIRLTGNCLASISLQKTTIVEFDPEAQLFFDRFELATTDLINNAENSLSIELWNRAHLKAMKLAALIAIGIDDYHPCINIQAAEWSVAIIERDINNVLAKFNAGKVGRDTNELNQIAEVAYIIRDYLIRPYDDLQKYQIDPLMHQDKVIPHAFLQRRLLQKGSMKNDRMGAGNAILRAVTALINEGSIREIRQLDLYERYKKTLKAYAVTDPARYIRT